MRWNTLLCSPILFDRVLTVLPLFLDFDSLRREFSSRMLVQKQKQKQQSSRINFSLPPINLVLKKFINEFHPIPFFL